MNIDIKKALEYLLEKEYDKTAVLVDGTIEYGGGLDFETWLRNKALLAE